jgi:peptidoglycan-associated lipoprotein
MGSFGVVKTGSSNQAHSEPMLKEDREMRTRSVGSVILLSLLALVTVGAGCKHPAAAVAPPPPPPAAPPPARPTVTLQASPLVVQKGQSVTLTWSSTNATALNLAPGVGNVAPQGSTSVNPPDSVTYTITATGPGGMADASVHVTVTAPPPPPPAAAPQPSIEDMFTKEVQDAFFDFDKADIRTDARDALSKTAEFLRSYPQVKVIVEGHCDERGSTEYNLALGDRRAQSAKDFLVSLGVAADRMQTVSYGKEKPFCTEHNEECWQQNRRAHFTMAK